MTGIEYLQQAIDGNKSVHIDGRVLIDASDAHKALELQGREKRHTKEVLKSMHFKTEQDLLYWANSDEGTEYIISTFKDVSNGDWVIHYIE